jgi:hypothetical protein
VKDRSDKQAPFGEGAYLLAIDDKGADQIDGDDGLAGEGLQNIELLVR